MKHIQIGFKLLQYFLEACWTGRSAHLFSLTPCWHLSNESFDSAWHTWTDLDNLIYTLWLWWNIITALWTSLVGTLRLIFIILNFFSCKSNSNISKAPDKTLFDTLRLGQILKMSASLMGTDIFCKLIFRLKCVKNSVSHHDWLNIFRLHPNIIRITATASKIFEPCKTCAKPNTNCLR